MRFIFVLIGIMTVTIACEKKSGSNPPVYITQQTPAPAEGSSSGGGSFGNESAKVILYWAAQDLARQIRLSSPEIYDDLPEGWTQERLANMVESVEMTEFPEVSRYDERLMFDYRVRADGTQYILATQLFADSYSHFEVNSRRKSDFYFTLNEVKLKLAHEVAHHMGFGLSKETDGTARRFASQLMEALDSDNIECVTSDWNVLSYVDDMLYLNDSPPAKERSRPPPARALVINRPTGLGVSPHNQFAEYCGDKLYCTDDVAKFGSAKLAVRPRTWHSPSGFTTQAVKFDLFTVHNVVIRGFHRPYGNYESSGPFSWSALDPRLAVFAEDGFISGHDYDNAEFQDFLDLSEIESSRTRYMADVSASAQESPIYADSRGRAKLSISIINSKAATATLDVMVVFNKNFMYDAIDRPFQVINFKCVRSFKPLEFYRRQSEVAK